MARPAGRTQHCSSEDAQARLDQAHKFFEVAKLLVNESNEDQDLEYASVAASLAVLAGIAAVDAACCQALNRRSRGQDHHQAEELVKQIVPGGEEASKQLRRLVNLKDEAHYGFHDVSRDKLKTTLRQTEQLIAFAEETEFNRR